MTEHASSGGRLVLLQAVAVVAALVLGARLVQLQVLESASYREVVRDERIRELPIEPARGRILDRNGVPVATNVARFRLSVVPGDVPEGDRQPEALHALARESHRPYADLERAVIEGRASVDPLAPVLLREEIPREEAIRIRQALAGVGGALIEAQPIREYGGGTLLAHILGHVAPLAPEDAAARTAEGYPLDARLGQSGLELTFERHLRGVAGRTLVRSTAYGRVLDTLAEEPAIPGSDLVLTIDLAFQQRVEDALARGIQRGLADTPPGKWHNPDSPREAGAAVALDVRTGEVLAMVSLPSFDANLLGAGRDDAALEGVINDPSRPLVDRAYMEVRSPGSIFKPIVAAAALQEGIAVPSTRITSTGAISIRDQYNPSVTYVFRDWAALGTLDLYGGLARSSDVYFYYLAGGFHEAGQRQFDGLGVERVASYARAAGLGAPTGIELPGESAGLVPDPAWKEDAIGDAWVLGDTYTLGIGQGYLTVTPLQMAVATAALANGGEVLRPTLVKELRRGAEVTPATPEVRGTLAVDPAHLHVVREAMRIAADPGGTAESGEPLGLRIGGKTGTAEFGAIAPDGSYDSHGWYIGFAPYEDPRIAVAVYIEHGVGATHAGPIAREIFEAYFGRGQRVDDSPSRTAP